MHLYRILQIESEFRSVRLLLFPVLRRLGNNLLQKVVKSQKSKVKGQKSKVKSQAFLEKINICFIWV